MTDAIAIDAINREQLATAADHLLLCGRPSARRAHNARRAANARIAMLAHDDRWQRGAVSRAHDAAPPIALRSLAADSAAHRPPRARDRGIGRVVFAFGVVIPTIVGIGLAVAALC